MFATFKKIFFKFSLTLSCITRSAATHNFKWLKSTNIPLIRD